MAIPDGKKAPAQLVVQQIATALGETKPAVLRQIKRIVQTIGEERALALLQHALEREQHGGLLLSDRLTGWYVLTLPQQPSARIYSRHFRSLLLVRQQVAAQVPVRLAQVPQGMAAQSPGHGAEQPGVPCSAPAPAIPQDLPARRVLAHPSPIADDPWQRAVGP
jgi:hypothetical protein